MKNIKNKISEEYKIRNPLKEEKVVAIFSKHWTVWFESLIPAILSIFTIKYAITSKSILLTEFNIVLSIFFILCSLYTVFELFGTEYIMTNKRIIINKGYLVKEKTDILIGRIESITTKQNFWGSFFGYGDITFNHDKNNTLSNIKCSTKSKDLINNYIDNIDVKLIKS